VASFLHRYVAGLRCVDPGYRSFEVRPRPGGGITSATTRHISPFGPIDVEWRLRARALELDLQVPPGTTATVVVPGRAAQTVPPGRHRWTGAELPAS
jgi:alpha-L-rhamnosidase